MQLWFRALGRTQDGPGRQSSGFARKGEKILNCLKSVSAENNRVLVKNSSNYNNSPVKPTVIIKMEKYQSKAETLVKRSEKKLDSPRFLCCVCGPHYASAAECLGRAAELYEKAEELTAAADCLERAVKLYKKAEELTEAAECLERLAKLNFQRGYTTRAAWAAWAAYCYKKKASDARKPGIFWRQ